MKIKYLRFFAAGVCLLILAACNPQPDQSIPADTQANFTESPTATHTNTPSMTRTNIQMDKNNGNADVLMVRAVQNSSGNWTFHVTVKHPDTGWEDYADGWDVLLPDGTAVLPDPNSPFTRLLLHPHETEQPFTRSQSNIVIPEEVTAVTVRAHDLVDGFGGEEVVVMLETAVVTETYEVILYQK